MCISFAPRTRSISRGKLALRKLEAKCDVGTGVEGCRIHELTGVQARIDERSETIETILHR